MKSKDVFPGVFSRHAKAYADRQGGRVPLGRRKVLEAVAAQPGERVLDLACGPGTLTLPLASSVGPEGRVLAIDMADGMLELLRELAPPWVETQRMDIEQMHLPSEAFDVVTCGHGYQFVPDLPHALAEARRVLDAGGRFAASAPIPGARPVRDALEEILNAFVPAPPAITDREATNATITDDARLAEALKTAGFRDVVVERCEEEVRDDSAEELVDHSLMWWSCAWRMEQVPEAERAAVRARLLAAVEERITSFPYVTSNWTVVFSGRA